MCIKKSIFFINSSINKLYNFMVLKYRNVNHEKLLINGKIRIFGRGKIIIGNNVKINSSLSSNPIGGQTMSIFHVNENGILEIGDNTGISNTAIVCRSNIKIGNNVKIGGNTKIYDTDFHSLNYNDRIDKLTDKPVNKPIIIEDGVFIGAHTIILKGVTIGEKSIIGAGSIVTKSIPPYEIWAGVPAKFIRKINI